MACFNNFRGGGNNCSLAAFHEALSADSSSIFSLFVPYLLLEMGRFGYCHSGHLYNNDHCFEPQCPDVFAFSILDSRPISSYPFCVPAIRRGAGRRSCRRCMSARGGACRIKPFMETISKPDANSVGTAPRVPSVAVAACHARALAKVGRPPSGF